MHWLDDFSQITPIHGDPHIASTKLYIVKGKKVVYRDGEEVGIPVIEPGDEVPPPGTVVYLLNVPGIADGMYEVSEDSKYLLEGSNNYEVCTWTVYIRSLRATGALTVS